MGLVSWEVRIYLFGMSLTRMFTPYIRFRSTATLILLTLQVGYKNPHRTINSYVRPSGQLLQMT